MKKDVKHPVQEKCRVCLALTLLASEVCQTCVYRVCVHQVTNPGPPRPVCWAPTTAGARPTGRSPYRVGGYGPQPPTPSHWNWPHLLTDPQHLSPGPQAHHSLRRLGKPRHRGLTRLISGGPRDQAPIAPTPSSWGHPDLVPTLPTLANDPASTSPPATGNSRSQSAIPSPLTSPCPMTLLRSSNPTWQLVPHPPAFQGLEFGWAAPQWFGGAPGPQAHHPVTALQLFPPTHDPGTSGEGLSQPPARPLTTTPNVIPNPNQVASLSKRDPEAASSGAPRQSTGLGQQPAGGPLPGLLGLPKPCTQARALHTAGPQ